MIRTYRELGTSFGNIRTSQAFTNDDMELPQLSPQTNELLGGLWAVESRSYVRRLFDSSDHRIALLKAIAASGEFAAIPSLLELLLDRSSLLRQAVADCLRQLLLNVTPQDLLALDEVGRSNLWWHRGRWRQLQVSAVQNLAPTAETAAAVLGLTSSHNSGFVREETIRELERIDDGSELPFLLLRLNDWVANVRAAAKSAVQKRLRPDYLHHFVRNIYLVVRLADCRRDEHDAVVSWVVGELASPANVNLLRSLLRSDDAVIRRSCLQQALSLPSPAQWLLVEGLRADDVMLRLRVAQYVRKSDRHDDLILTMERDKFMPVRREALLSRLQRAPEGATPCLEHALMDRSAAVREIARFQLRKLGREDLADVYRAAILERRELEIALCGLGETGKKTDVGLLSPHLVSPKSRIRSAAVLALGSLGGEEVCEALLPILADERSRVSQAARNGLQNHLAQLDPERLWNLLGEAPRRHLVQGLLHLMDRHGSWSGLPYLIQLAGNADEDIARRASKHLYRRITAVFSTPSHKEQEQTKKALEAVRGKLKESLQKDLDSWLRYRGVLSG